MRENSKRVNGSGPHVQCVKRFGTHCLEKMSKPDREFIAKVKSLYNAYLAGSPIDELKASANKLPESVIVKGNWDSLALTEYEVLINPGLRLVGELDSNGQPRNVRVETNDSGEWSNCGADDVLLWFAYLVL